MLFEEKMHSPVRYHGMFPGGKLRVARLRGPTRTGGRNNRNYFTTSQLTFLCLCGELLEQ